MNEGKLKSTGGINTGSPIIHNVHSASAAPSQVQQLEVDREFVELEK